MAKSKIPNQKRKYALLERRTARYLSIIDAIYEAHNREVANVASLIDIDKDKLFSFEDYPETHDAVTRLKTAFANDLKTTIINGINEEWHNAQLAHQQLRDIVKQRFLGVTADAFTMAFTETFNNRDGALKAFKERTDNGANLSSRIWNQTEEYVRGIEASISLGIQQGKSAVSLARTINQYQNNVEQLNEDLASLRERKGIIDNKTKQRIKNVKFNSQRLARTEINMAYRTAEQERWRGEDYIVGYEVKRGRRKKNDKGEVEDYPCPVCGMLKGRYPKDFKFVGWHPMCRCYVVPIMMTKEEFWADKKIKESENYVADTPEGFKQWVTKNKDRILTFHGTRREPYFVRDNWEKIKQTLTPKKTPMEIAKERHALRTPEQIKDIKQRAEQWRHKQQIIRTTAQNVLNVAKEYNEVDFAKLHSLTNTTDLKAIKAETRRVSKAISKVKKQERALADIIPNVHEWHKQFTIEELKEAYSAVKKKFEEWEKDGFILEIQAQKLHFEAFSFLGGNMNNVQSKYKTWQVSQAAYIKRLGIVETQIEVEKIKIELTSLKSFSAQHTKAKNLKKYITSVENGINSQNVDLNDVKTQLAKANAEKLKIEKRAAKNQASTTSSSFDQNDYTQDAKDKALWAKTTKRADNKLRDVCKEVWLKATQEEREAIYGYTMSYHNIQEPLRGIPYFGSETDAEKGLKRIPLITDLISKSSYNFNMWVQRGDDYLSLKKFGLSNPFSASAEDILGLVGKEGVEGGFWSAAVSKGKGFVHKPIIFNVYMPKGTQAMYCEPFSYYGKGAYNKANWLGETQTKFGKEAEILIQRGTKYKVTKVEQAKGKWYIDVEIIEQNPLPFPYANGYPYL